MSQAPKPKTSRQIVHYTKCLLEYVNPRAASLNPNLQCRALGLQSLFAIKVLQLPGPRLDKGDYVIYLVSSP